MAERPLDQRKRDAIVGGVLLAITLIASTASILPFVGVTSLGQLGTAATNVIAAYSRGLVWLAGYSGIIGFSLLIALCAVYLVRLLWLARRKTDRRWRIYEAALALPLLAALLVPFYIPKPVPPPLTPLPDDQQVWREGLIEPGLSDTLDPAVLTSANWYLVDSLVFPGLVKLDKDSKAQNWAASRVQLARDGTSYTFTLHAGIKWSDGAPIGAEDFAYSINRTLDPCTDGGFTSFLQPIKDAVTFHSQQCDGGKVRGEIPTLIGRSLLVTDPLTLTIRLERPTPSFLAQLTYPSSWAVPRKLVDKYGADWAKHFTDDGGLGGDLFKMTILDLGHRVVLQRNERFWGAKSKLREIDFTLYSGNVDTGISANYAAYIAGEREVVGIGRAAVASASLRPDYHTADALILEYFSLNWAAPPFDDLRMRQAFALALDKEQLARAQIFCGACAATNHLVPKGMPGYNADLKGPDSTTNLTGNNARARAAAQSYANDKCAGKLSQCPPVTFRFPTETQVGMQEAKDMWEAAMPDYPITLQPHPFDDTYFDPPLQISWAPWSADYADPQDFLSLWFLPGANLNWNHVDVPAATTLMRQADSELDPGKRLNEYKQAEQLLVTNIASIPVIQEENAYLLRANVVNYQGSPGNVSADTWQRLYLGKL
jgi:peptide/nickel transport system substrate-binding protein/oligopeptide transport system substrate-binding protein